MIDAAKNRHINQALSTLYETYRDDYLSAYCAAFRDPDPPRRINEFGIIDVNRYDADAGVLFVAKETNGWDNHEFASGQLFRRWLEDTSRDGLEGTGHAQRHPNMWYNLGRWALFLNGAERDIDTIASCKKEALQALGTVAFTNLNKVRGLRLSKKAYRTLASADISGQLLREEITLLQPKTIVCCGTSDIFRLHIPAFPGTVVHMPHPAARLRPAEMIHRMASQLAC